MVLVKILERKDASSVVVAIVAAMVILQLLGSILVEPASWLSGTHGSHGSYGTSFKEQYLFPVVLFVLEFLAFELVVRAYIAISTLVQKKGR